MNIELATFIKNVCDEIGNQEARIVNNYSGRGMGNQQTNGVVIESQAILIADLIQYMQGNISPDGGTMAWIGIPPNAFDIADIRTDNVGNNIILY